MTDLRKLIEAVEAGRDIYPSDFPVMFKGIPWAIRAHEGSLDAAKVLHEALLDYGWYIETFGMSGEVVLRRRRPVGRQYGFSDGNPSRAWLLAVLKAYEVNHG